MRFLFAAILFVIVDTFTFRALSNVFLPATSQWQIAVCALFWSIPIAATAYVFLAERGYAAILSRKARTFSTALIIIVYFSKLLVALVVALDDVRRGVAWLINGIVPDAALSMQTSAGMSKAALVLGAIPLITLIYGLVRNPYRYRTIRKDIVLPEIPEALDGLKIVQISDIHTGSLLSPDRVSKSVEMINALEPDLVFFTGDLVNNSADEADEYVSLFGQIRAKHGVFSVTGNHDYGDYMRWPDAESKRRNFEKLMQQHTRMGWNLLMNTHHTVSVSGARISVIGVENYSAHPRFPKYGDMKKAVTGLDRGALNILLSHDPSHWDDEITTRYPWVDLMLSGHTHGFQFGIEVGRIFRWSPVQYVYRRWAGLYRQGNQFLYVNRGLGFLGYPGRVGILPEITLLTIRKGETSKN